MAQWWTTGRAVRRPRRMTRVAAVVAATALGAAACGSDDESVEADGEESSTAAVESPIGEYLGYDYSDPETAEQEYAEQEQQRQELIAACMQDQGFEYVPYVNADMVSFDSTSEDGLEWGSKEWTEKYGYGVTTMWFSQEAVGPDLVGYEGDQMVSEGEGSDDPNVAIMEGLSEAEAEAYNTALWGDPDDQPVIDESLTEEEIQEQFDNWEPSGCSAEADDEVYGSDAANEFYMEFGDEMEELYQSIEADPRIVELEQKVSDCVADKGLEYVSEEDYWEELEPEQTELMEDVTWPGQDLTPEEVEAMTPEERDELYSQPEQLTDEARQRLGELQEKEIELAVTVQECGGGQSQNQDLYNEVRVEYEQNFLDEHAEELEGLDLGEG